MRASSKPSCARPVREGGSHDHSRFSARRAQGQRRARGQLFACRRRRRNACPRNQARRAHRGRFLSGHRSQRSGDPLYRKGRSRDRHRNRAAADRGRRTRRAAQRDQARCRRHRAHARPGQDLGQPVDPSRRHAAAQRRGDRQGCAARAGWQPPGRQGGRPQGCRRRGQRRQQAGQLRRIGRRQIVRTQARSCQAHRGQGPQRLQARGQAGAARRHSGQSDGTFHLYARLPRARHVARPGHSPAGDRRYARERRRDVGQGYSRGGQGRASGQFPRCCCRERMGCDQGGAEAQGIVVDITDAAGLGEAVGRGARKQGRQGRSDDECRRYRRGPRPRRRQDDQGHLRFRHPHPRLDRAVLRGGAVQGWAADLLVGLASDA